MVWQKEALGYTCAKIAQNLCVDKSTVSRTLKLFHTTHVTGSVSKRPYPKERAFRKLTTPAQLLILHLCLSRPGIYLREIRDELLLVLEIDVNESAICKFLRTSGFQALIQKFCMEGG
jgi:transposase